MICQLHLTLAVFLLIIKFKLASLATNLNLNINDMLTGEGVRSNYILKVTKDKGSTLVTLKDTDSAWLTPNLNVFSWPGKRAGRSDATNENGLNSRSQLISGRKNFTVYIAVHNKTSASKTRYSSNSIILSIIIIIIKIQMILIIIAVYHQRQWMFLVQHRLKQKVSSLPAAVRRYFCCCCCC